MPQFTIENFCMRGREVRGKGRGKGIGWGSWKISCSWFVVATEHLTL